MKLKLLNEKLLKFLTKEQILMGEPLKNHTSFKIGGKCIALIKPRSEKQVIKTIKTLKKLKFRFYVIGNGTNLLVSSKGVNAVFVKLGRQFNNITVKDNVITAEAGASMSALNEACIEHSLTGLEWSSGIPGSIGGALVQNAGAYKGEIKDVVNSALVYTGKKLKLLNRSQLKLGYRTSVFKKKIKYVIISVKFNLKKGVQEQIKTLSYEHIIKRKNNQPLNFPSAGSVFKRHNGFIISKAIDELGLKGFKIGGAEISTKHAGFIVNKENATSDDVLKVIEHIKHKIYEKHKIKLEIEVLYIGE